MLQSRTKLLEKDFPIMSTFLRNKTISKTTPLRKENPFPQFNVASHKRPGIRLSFEYTTTLLSGEEGEGRTGTATIFRKMLSKYTIFLTDLILINEEQHCLGERENICCSCVVLRKWLTNQKENVCHYVSVLHEKPKKIIASFCNLVARSNFLGNVLAQSLSLS